MNAALADSLVNLAAHPIAWPLARALRRAGPAVHVPWLGLVINDAALARDVLVRGAEFTKNGRGSIAAQMTAALGPTALGNMDGDAHRALRATLADLFAPAEARRLLGGCEAPVVGLQEALGRGETVDLVRFMRVLSGRVTFGMLGIPLPADDPDAACLELLALGERIAAGISLRPGRVGMSEGMTRDCARLAALARAGYDGAASGGSLVARLRLLGLSVEEARGVISLVFLAGTITTAASLPRIVALLVDSGQQGAARGEGGVARAVAEALRCIAPVPATVRIASCDTTLGGRKVAAGTRLVLLTCNAARDAALFPHPDRFDAGRVHDARARHLWYGAGAHFCLGFAVAQRQLGMMVEAVLCLGRPLEIAHRRPGGRGLVAAYRRLDVRLAPGPA